MAQGRLEATPAFAGKYRLLEEIGAGAMGVVRRARDDVLDTDVAVKLFTRHRDPAVAEASLAEARAIARLTHPAIVRVLDYGALEDGAPFVVMELLRGETLADALERAGKLGATDAIRLLLPIIDALSVAHAQGVVHRDLKPANLFLATDDRGGVQPKVLDFGLAQLSSETPPPGSVERVVAGTPSYMSPEQATGEPTGPPSDMWSLCVVLYEAVVGTPPFDDPDQRKMIKAILDKPPRPIPAGDVDPDLVAILHRGLRKEAAERWGSMRELGSELAEWLLGQGITEDACGTALRVAWLAAPTSIDTGRVVSRPPPRFPSVHSARHSKTVVSAARRLGDAQRRRRMIGGAVALTVALLLTAWLVMRSVTPDTAARPSIASGSPTVPTVKEKPPAQPSLASSLAPSAAPPASTAAPTSIAAPTMSAASSSSRPPSATPPRPTLRPTRGKGGKFEDLGF